MQSQLSPQSGMGPTLRGHLAGTADAADGGAVPGEAMMQTDRGGSSRFVAPGAMLLVALIAVHGASTACGQQPAGAGGPAPQAVDPLAPAFAAFLEGEKLSEGPGHQPAAAVAAFERAVALQPEVAVFQLRRDAATNNLRSLQDALAEADQDLARSPNEARLYCVRGTRLRLLGQYDQGVEAHRRCTSLNPDPDSYQRLGDALLEAGRYAEAVTSYEQGLAAPSRIIQSLRESEQGRLTYGRGRALLRMAERERALADFEAAMQKLLSQGLQAQAYRALTLQQLGRQAEAQETYDRYRRAWPSGDLERQARLPRIAEAGNALGQFFLREGLPEPALEAFEHVLSGHPGDVEALIGRGAALVVLGRHEEARRWRP